jgi:hypothetical protein
LCYNTTQKSTTQHSTPGEQAKSAARSTPRGERRGGPAEEPHSVMAGERPFKTGFQIFDVTEDYNKI